MKNIISERIREARVESSLTQQEVAKKLGKTAASISDLERGKVQVSASDLYQISQILNKPIKYFYGEENEEEIKNLIAMIREQSPEGRENAIEIHKLIIQMQEIGDKLTLDSDSDPSVNDIKKFLDAFISFKKYIIDLDNQLNEIKDILINELKAQGIEI